jgi:hypothetical protein
MPTWCWTCFTQAPQSYFRQAMYPSGIKSDPLDADVQLDLLVKHRDRLQVWKPDTEETRLMSFRPTRRGRTTWPTPPS